MVPISTAIPGQQLSTQLVIPVLGFKEKQTCRTVKGFMLVIRNQQTWLLNPHLEVVLQTLALAQTLRQKFIKLLASHHTRTGGRSEHASLRSPLSEVGATLEVKVRSLT